MASGFKATVKKYTKKILPDSILFLYRAYHTFRHNKKTVRKFKNLTADDNVSVAGVCTFEEGVRAGKNVAFANVSVGRCVYFSSNNMVTDATIGRFCSIGPYARIGLSVHPSKTFVTTYPAFYLNRSKFFVSYADKDYISEHLPTHIGNDVWIGENALIKGGVTVGNGAIIGAGAVVVKDVSPYSIVGGVPAKLIRYRFTPEQITFLEEFRWWNKPDEWLSEHWRDFFDIEKFVAKHRDKKGRGR